MKGIKKTIRCADSSRVKPLEGSYIDRCTLKNSDYLFSLDCDRMLCSIRSYAGIDTLGKTHYSGWEQSGHGIFFGHYLHALCLLYQTAKGLHPEVAEEAKRRVDYIVGSLAECRRAIDEKIGSGPDYPEAPGYLCPLPAWTLDRAQNQFRRPGAHDATSLPFYDSHKVMAGLSAAYRTGNGEALSLLRGMGDYLIGRLKEMSHEQRERMLNTRRLKDFFMEYGGIQQVFLDLYEYTGEDIYRKASTYFDRGWFNEMLEQNRDELASGMDHTNTELPVVLSLARYYEVTGDMRYRTAVENFMRWMAEGHELPTGGLSGRSPYPDYLTELYHYPKKIYPHVMDTPARKNIGSGESCCSHNMNRICERVLEWTADAQYGDAWERRFVNGVLAQQNAETGMFLYNLNVKNGSRKQWGIPEGSFWCCYGTGMEIFSSLTNGAYYTGDGSLWANLYMPCMFRWEEQGVTVRQETDYPNRETIAFTFSMEHSTAFDFRLRIPGWLKRPAQLQINGGAAEAIAPGAGFLSVKREWNDGDTVTLTLPFDPWGQEMPDRPEYIAVFYGPNLLVPCTGFDTVFPGTKQELLDSLAPNGVPCCFTAQLSSHSNGVPIPDYTTYKPIRRLTDETYHGYTRISKPAAEVVCDRILMSDPASLTSHHVAGEGLSRQDDKGRFYLVTEVGGNITFTAEADPGKPLYLKLTYCGDDSMYIVGSSLQPIVRLFDLQVQAEDGSWNTFCTQTLQGDYPGEFFYELYPIPQEWTAGKKQLRFRLQSKPFHELQGITGRIFDTIQLHTYNETF